MHRTGTRQTARTGHRTRRPSLNPHFMDEIAFTLRRDSSGPRSGRFAR